MTAMEEATARRRAAGRKVLTPLPKGYKMSPLEYRMFNGSFDALFAVVPLRFRKEWKRTRRILLWAVKVVRYRTGLPFDGKIPVMPEPTDVMGREGGN